MKEREPRPVWEMNWHDIFFDSGRSGIMATHGLISDNIGEWPMPFHPRPFLRLTAISIWSMGMAWPAALRAEDPRAVGVRDVKAIDTLGTDRYALIVGINDYADKNIPDLKYAEADARAVYDALINPTIGGIDSAKTTLLLGADATTRAIRKALTQLRGVPKNSTVFIFFSGHGAKEAGEAFWVTQDAELGGLGFSALPDREIRTLTDRIESTRLIMLLDCCYAAATVGGQKAVVDFAEATRGFTGKGRVTITGSGSGEESIEAGDLKHGVFAHYLLEGLSGKADGADGAEDGIVTLPELTTFLDRTVAEAARSRQGIQKPAIFMQEVQEPAKFLITIDAARIQTLLEQARLTSQQTKARLDALKTMFVDDQITDKQYQLGRQLLESPPERLDPPDRERLDAFVELTDGKLPTRRLAAVLDTIETPEQREARLRRERVATQARDLVASFNDAAKRNEYEAAKQAVDELRRLSPEHGALAGMASRLNEMTPPVPKELTLDCGGAVKLECVLIPAGEFMMGSPQSEARRFDDEGPQHLVRFAQPFYMGKYEVTQAQWEAVMGSNSSYFTHSRNLPVETVSWEDCQSFCRKLSSRSGQTVRLPSEAEWEYACRAGTTTRFFFGDSDTKLALFAWCRVSSDHKTHDVGQLRPNTWGLYDMHGNVWEWCEDWFHENYEGAPKDGRAWVSGVKQDGRVLRGGSWFYVDSRYLRSANRSKYTPDGRNDNLGFRVVVMGSGTTP